MVHQAARALDHAHRSGLVHRDVKPANLLVQRGVDDDPDHVYLADFGITKHALSRSGLTPTGQFMGTIDYIAPEQVQSRVIDGRADTYSLGCVLYESLTGQVPFVKEADAAVIWAHVEEQPTAPSRLRPELGEDFDDVMSRVLAKNPDDRYASAREFVEAAKTALAPRDTRPQTLLGNPGDPQWSAETQAGPGTPVGSSRGATPVGTAPVAATPTPTASAAAWGDARSDPGKVEANSAARVVDASQPPDRSGPSGPSGPFDSRDGGTASQRPSRVSGWLVPVVMTLLVVLAIGGVWYGLQQRDSTTTSSGSQSSDPSANSGKPSSSPSADAKAEAPSSNVLMRILTDTNKEPKTRGHIPLDDAATKPARRWCARPRSTTQTRLSSRPSTRCPSFTRRISRVCAT